LAGVVTSCDADLPTQQLLTMTARGGVRVQSFTGLASVAV
jgi:hypothetical protein